MDVKKKNNNCSKNSNKSNDKNDKNLDEKKAENVDDKLVIELRDRPKEKKVKQIPEEELKKSAKDREKKKRTIIQKIVQVVKREVKTYKELIINSEPLERRVALLEDGVLENFHVERRDEVSMVGAIYKGKIQNLEPGLKAAFVDIGEPKNAFLHYWDILPSDKDSSIEFVRQNKSKEQSQREKISIKDIPKKYPIGTEIIVQITKAQIGSKGPRTTTNISMPGRYIVLMPFAGQCGISRKIEDKKERSRLKAIIKKLQLPEGMGIIVRTAAEGKRERYFVRDLHMLLKQWEKIVTNIEEAKEPACLYREPGILEVTVRDFLTEDIDRVLVDDKDDHNEIMEVVSQISKRSKSKIAHFDENIPIFERYNIERQIHQTFMRNVPLPSGGEIVIEETEALIAVDVNTGGHKGAKDGSNFIVQANLEAAKEVARQIRLRDIGGLIIIDFIDMKQKRDRNAVYKVMKDEMAGDKAKSHVLPISLLGILQMTRQRHNESMASVMYEKCPYCHGTASVKSPRTISVEIQRRLLSIARYQNTEVGASNEQRELLILLHPVSLERLRNDDEQVLVDMQNKYNVKLSFRSDANFHCENYKVVDAKTEKELF